jgi:Tol biopolymer transport system component
VGNGREIVYLSPRDRPDGVSQVVRQSLPTGAATALYDAARDGVLRSPDGNWLAFRARVNGKEQLLVMPSRGGRAVAVRVPSTADRVSWIMWLPDGNAMLGVTTPASQAGGEASPEVTFWRIPLDGSMPTAAGRMRLPAYQNARFNARHYSLNPDGTRIAFERHAGVVNQVWAIDHMLGFIQSGASVPSRELRR